MATIILVILSLIFFGTSVWVKLYFPQQSAFGDRLWDLSYLFIGAMLALLKSEASGKPNPTTPAEPASENK